MSGRRKRQVSVVTGPPSFSLFCRVKRKIWRSRAVGRKQAIAVRYGARNDTLYII
jgi:hypothetical protein